MKEYPIKTRVELVAFKELEGESKTKITFQGFDASITDADLPLPPGEQLDHIQSLQPPNITVKDGIIYWDGKREPPTTASRGVLSDFYQHFMSLNASHKFKTIILAYLGGYLSQMCSLYIAWHTITEIMYPLCITENAADVFFTLQGEVSFPSSNSNLNH